MSMNEVIGLISGVLTLFSIEYTIDHIIIIILFGTVYSLYSLYYLRYKEYRYRNNHNQLCKYSEKALGKALLYLEKYSSNKLDNGIRTRITESIMESATVIGAIIMARKFFNRKAIGCFKKRESIDYNLIHWIFTTLIKRFRYPNEILKGFDCVKCYNNTCNVSFFDYLSHFIYIKETPEHRLFLEQFNFLPSLLFSRIKKFDFHSSELMGWGVNNESIFFDPFVSATNLHLCLLLGNYKINDDVINIAKSIIITQSSNGSWVRNIESQEHCGGNIPIITTHRCIETLSILMKLSKSNRIYLEENIKKEITFSIEKASGFLLSTPLIDDPVKYQKESGFIEPEKYRCMLHIIQGLLKASIIDKKILEKDTLKMYINLILKSQNPKGAFKTSIELSSYTDITSMAIRTLVIYIETINLHYNR